MVIFFFDKKYIIICKGSNICKDNYGYENDLDYICNEDKKGYYYSHISNYHFDEDNHNDYVFEDLKIAPRNKTNIFYFM